jgi:hypothetical protein
MLALNDGFGEPTSQCRPIERRIPPANRKCVVVHEGRVETMRVTWAWPRVPVLTLRALDVLDHLFHRRLPDVKVKGTRHARGAATAL